MATVGASLAVALCLLRGQQTSAKNDAPCQPTKWNNAYHTFLKRHIRDGTPTTLNQNEWEKYIRYNGGCERPTQSFIHPKDLDKVRDVCTNAGGKVFKNNLCISKDPFSFITVRSEPGTCGIRSVRQETKHLILACELLDNQCLPVHFEGNPDNATPSNNAKGCQERGAGGDAPSFKSTWLWMLLALFVIIYSIHIY